jgi:hypothetical protein
LDSVFDFLELLTVLNGGLGDLDDDLLLGLGGLGGNLGLLNLSGDLFFVGECSESVWLHVLLVSEIKVSFKLMESLKLLHSLIRTICRPKRDPRGMPVWLFRVRIE